MKLLFLSFLLAIIAAPIGATDRLAIRVSPAVAFAPANLIVRTTVEADQNNRAIAVVAESSDFYRSSEIQLDGEKAPRTTMFEFRSVPSGNYNVRAVLLGSRGQELASVQYQVNVVPGGKAS